MEKFDVAVMGGGTAGLIAAIQAGRAGAKTVLIEKNGICGGTMTVGGINKPGLFDAWGKQIIKGIGWELVTAALTLAGKKLPERFLDPDSNTRHWEHQIELNPLLYAACGDQALLEAGVDIRYHTMSGALQFSGNRWLVTLCGKDGLYDIESKVVIDCTGDANAVKQAGLPFTEHRITQPGTLSVRAHNFDLDKIDPAQLEKNFYAAVESGTILPGDLCWGKRFNTGFLKAGGKNKNHICNINGAESFGRTQMEIAGRASILRSYRFLKQQVGLENIEFDLNSPECGVRETRVIAGEHTITRREYLAGISYPDAVCNAFYQIDFHDGEEGLISEKLAPGIVPQVPLRALIPQGSSNFLAAGRIISSDRAANSALRVQAVCMATGQAAGAVAAICAATNRSPLDIPKREWKELLEKNEAVIP